MTSDLPCDQHRTSKNSTLQYSTLSAQGCQDVLLIKQLVIRSVSQLGQVAIEVECRVFDDIRVMADVLYPPGAA